MDLEFVTVGSVEAGGEPGVTVLPPVPLTPKSLSECVKGGLVESAPLDGVNNGMFGPGLVLLRCVSVVWVMGGLDRGDFLVRAVG